MAASLRPPILYRTSYHGIHGHEAVINRAPRRILVPAQSPFGFGADSGKVSQNEKTAQLEEEVLSKVRGAVPGSLAANKQDEIDVLLSKAGSFKSRDLAKELEGTYKLVYTDKNLVPAAAGITSQTLIIKDGVYQGKAHFSTFGILPGIRQKKGPISISGANAFTVTWTESFIKSLLHTNYKGPDIVQQMMDNSREDQ